MILHGVSICRSFCFQQEQKKEEIKFKKWYFGSILKNPNEGIEIVENSALEKHKAGKHSSSYCSEFVTYCFILVCYFAAKFLVWVEVFEKLEVETSTSCVT